MTNAAITIGVVVGSFSIVAVFAIVIACVARAKNRERLVNGTAFAYIRHEESRFHGIINRLEITPKRPDPASIFELQDYYDSKECGSGWEREAIEYTFKMM